MPTYSFFVDIPGARAIARAIALSVNREWAEVQGLAALGTYAGNALTLIVSAGSESGVFVQDNAAAVADGLVYQGAGSRRWRRVSGAASSQWRVGTAPPANNLGRNGDFFLLYNEATPQAATNGTVYVRENGVYVVRARLGNGATPNVPGFLQGDGPPNAALGKMGDSYVDRLTLTRPLWEKTVLGWVKTADLNPPSAGSGGATGTASVNANGNYVLNGYTLTQNANGNYVFVGDQGNTTNANGNVVLGNFSSGGGSAAVAPKSHTHTQAAASALWTINHNLGYYPSVTVFSVGGNEVEADVRNPNVNQTTVEFSAPFAGSARLV